MEITDPRPESANGVIAPWSCHASNSSCIMGPKSQRASHGRQVIWCQEWARCTSYLRAVEFLLWANRRHSGALRGSIDLIRSSLFLHIGTLVSKVTTWQGEKFHGSFGQEILGGTLHEDKSLVRRIHSPLSDEPGKAMLRRLATSRNPLRK